jgi:hypothetical protein
MRFWRSLDLDHSKDIGNRGLGKNDCAKDMALHHEKATLLEQNPVLYTLEIRPHHFPNIHPCINSCLLILWFLQKSNSYSPDLSRSRLL